MLTDISSRGSAIGIGLPEFAPLLDRWRRWTMPSATPDVPPHISLIVPWRPAPVASADVAAVAAAVDGVRPFQLTFRVLECFSAARVLYLRPEPDGPVRELIRRLTRAFPETPPYGGAVADVIPHLTVAVAAPDENLLHLQGEIWRDLSPRLPLEALVDEITIAEEQDDGSWSSAYTIPLLSQP